MIFSPSISLKLHAIDDSHLGVSMSEEILENFKSSKQLRLSFSNSTLAGNGNVYFSPSGFQDAYNHRKLNQTPSGESSFNAIMSIRNTMSDNASDIQTAFINSAKNPRGEGIFVYFFSIETNSEPHLFLWFVKDGQAIALNEPSKDETPDLPLPNEAGIEVWANTGLDANSVVSVGIGVTQR